MRQLSSNLFGDKRLPGVACCYTYMVLHLHQRERTRARQQPLREHDADGLGEVGRELEAEAQPRHAQLALNIELRESVGDACMQLYLRDTHIDIDTDR